MHFDKIDRKEFKRTNAISRKYNIQWKKYAGRNCIGDCSNLFQRLRPVNYYDFYLKYTQDGIKTAAERNTFKYSGRTEKEIEELAVQYKNECGDDSFPLESYIKNIYMHAIIETFDGQMKELQINQLLTNMGYTYEKPEKNEDSRYGIDFKVYKGGTLVFMLQIKPISFFKGVDNLSLIEDRLSAFRKQSLVQQRYKVPTYYMVYKMNDNGTVRWMSENGKLCFELQRLCNGDSGLPNTLPTNFISL